MKLLAGISSLLLAASLAAADLPGLQAGDRAPGFELTRSTGELVSLKGLLDQGPVALVFVRSADWCPFCRRQLQDLQGALPAISAAGVRLVALSYDPPATNAAAVEKLGLTYPLLSDPGSKVIDAYGIRNLEAKGRAAGIPHPAIFIVDRQGVIRTKLMRDGYRERPDAAEIIAAAQALK